ncbi:AAA family ATPase [Ktedonospora formicarum]|uniref:Uncharacterized protein n=1 Tax=Ktedonospora formicarum TaxID=2778364 RepID=A0A8J3MYD1_9CHLR|nr:hypothetical protein [Ktedonospora formicarum]GHO49520.1 hypothetical protein KSX_76830 [Ktedonospora formicarum]
MTLTSAQLPTLIVVSGFPATGKSSLGRRLANHFMLPFMGKDMAKELLCEILGCEDLTQSQLIGRASMRLLYQFAENILRVRQSCIIESVFYPQFAIPDLKVLRERYPYQPLEIFCVAEQTILEERWQRRSNSGERHPGHMEQARNIPFPPKEEQVRPLVHGAPSIVHDTSNFATIDYEALIARVQTYLDTTL